jgi:hypothetical protein
LSIQKLATRPGSIFNRRWHPTPTAGKKPNANNNGDK